MNGRMTMSETSRRVVALKYKDHTYADNTELHKIRFLVTGELFTDEHSEAEADHVNDKVGGDVK
jgi:hypothetical protein